MPAARTLLALLSLIAPAAAQRRDAPDEAAPALARAMATAPRPHPRLFLHDADVAALRRRIDQQPLLQQAMQWCLDTADAIEAAAPVSRRQTGRRLLSVSRTCLKRVVHLAFAHRMTGERRYLQRAQREMLAAAAFADWNPSHFLDVAEMTAALAIGYDWLHDDLDADARRAILAAIVAKGLEPSLRGGWWVRTSNNWNQVCHGGLTLGALAVQEHEPELALRIVQRAQQNLPRAMAEYEPDGAYPEGPGYWVYGTTYNVLLLDALRTALGDDFGLGDAAGLMASADYLVHVTGPTDRFYNYSDGGSSHRVSPAMRWFAATRNAPHLLWHETEALRRHLREQRPSAGNGHRLFPFALIWADRERRAEPPTRHYRARGRTPIATHRSGWGTDATFVAIKSGTPSANHGHMDIGSFVLDADGVRWAVDLGSQSYHGLESKGIRLWDRSQGSQRWTVFRLNSLSHNTLVVDGARQRVQGRGELLAFAADGPMPHTIVDLAAAYRGQLDGPRRGVGLLGEAVVVQDEFTTLDRPTTTVRWGMVTEAEVTLDGSTAVLQQDGKRLVARVLAPAGAAWKVYDTATPKAPHDAPNPGTCMLGFEVGLAARSEQRLQVVLVPGDGALPDGARLPGRLSTW
ncbi:MAG: heparinase II/III family protein [Planctomycetota bacterium]